MLAGHFLFSVSNPSDLSGSFSAETPVSGGCFVFSDPFLSVKGSGFSRLEPW